MGSNWIAVNFRSVPLPLASGLVAKVSIHPAAGRSEQLTYVPVAALVEGSGDRASVFVLQGSTVKRRAVRVAFFSGEDVALAEGIAIGEPVVTEGALYLADGDTVEVVKEAGRAVGSITPLLAQPGSAG